MIAWRDVSVTFGKTRVVGPLSLEVGRGEWLGLIGPNGAGKSTLLKAAVGVVNYEGSVDVGEHDLRRGLDIAWMPQRPRLPEEMSVSDYVLLGRTPHLGYVGGETQHDLESVMGSLKRLDLSAFAARRFADRLAMMASGEIVADGDASTVLTEENLVKHYGAGIRVVNNGDGPTVIPTRIQRD